MIHYESDETLEQVAQKRCGCPRLGEALSNLLLWKVAHGRASGTQ